MKILDENSFFDFNKFSKNYNVNVFKNSRTVHRKNGCHCSKLYQFIPFDTLEEIEQFQKKHNVKFTFCYNRDCGFKR